MAEQELQTRIALKYDTYANWTNTTMADKGANLILLKGEIGICETVSLEATTAPTVLFKVGDGSTPFNKLKWMSALAADVHEWAKADTVVLNEKLLQFKTGDTVKYSVDLSTFVTNTELSKIEATLESKSDINHTHTTVNGYTIVVSEDVPTVDDRSIITFVIK